MKITTCSMSFRESAMTIELPNMRARAAQKRSIMTILRKRSVVQIREVEGVGRIGEGTRW
jgi:hypothetical protein